MGAPFSGAGKPVSPTKPQGASATEVIGEMDDDTGMEEEGRPEAQGEIEGETGQSAHRTLRRPEEPTQKEFEEHMVLHLPFRAW